VVVVVTINHFLREGVERLGSSRDFSDLGFFVSVFAGKFQMRVWSFEQRFSGPDVMTKFLFDIRMLVRCVVEKKISFFQNF
jgi:hypothetical protein